MSPRFQTVMNTISDRGAIRSPLVLLTTWLVMVARASTGAGVESVLEGGALAGERPRIIVSTDIGGTDPDDFQSMVHLLVYADVLEIEGLISSPFDAGRKRHILDVIDCYESDFPNLKTYSHEYPTPNSLRSVTKQGEIERAPYAGVRRSTEGSRWIIECARRDDPRPLHVLVWGGIEDLAQALHDAPEILPKLRVYYIGGPNKKWGPDAYQYIADHHPALRIIEANATYRGWFTGGNQADEWNNREFVNRHIKGHGALGDFFVSKKDNIKMGDTPSVGWVLRGIAGNPARPGWGGRFVQAWERPRLQLNRMPRAEDRIEIFGVLELALPFDESRPEQPKVFLQVENQELNGFAPGDGTIRFRFSPKAAKTYRFDISGDVESLNGMTGEIISYLPANEVSIRRSPDLPNWWTDDPDPKFSDSGHHGARTVNRWREDYLSDFAARMLRCKQPASAEPNQNN